MFERLEGWPPCAVRCAESSAEKLQADAEVWRVTKTTEQLFITQNSQGLLVNCPMYLGVNFVRRSASAPTRLLWEKPLGATGCGAGVGWSKNDLIG